MFKEQYFGILTEFLMKMGSRTIAFFVLKHLKMVSSISFKRVCVSLVDVAIGFNSLSRLCVLMHVFPSHPIPFLYIHLFMLFSCFFDCHGNA